MMTGLLSFLGRPIFLLIGLSSASGLEELCAPSNSAAFFVGLLAGFAL
jgi:hypothetical protein